MVTLYKTYFNYMLHYMMWRFRLCFQKINESSTDSAFVFEFHTTLKALYAHLDNSMLNCRRRKPEKRWFFYVLMKSSQHRIIMLIVTFV